MVEYLRGIKAGVFSGLVTGIIFAVIVSILAYQLLSPGLSVPQNAQGFQGMRGFDSGLGKQVLMPVIINLALVILGIGIFSGIVLGFITSILISKLNLKSIHATVISAFLLFSVALYKILTSFTYLEQMSALYGQSLQGIGTFKIVYVAFALVFLSAEGLLSNYFWNRFNSVPLKN